MRYHKQQHLYVPESQFKGSCYPTVISCILDLEIDFVPNFHLFYYTTEEEQLLKKVLQKKYGSYTKLYHSNYSIAQNMWENSLTFFLASKGYMITRYEQNEIDQWLKNNVDVPYIACGTTNRGTDHVVIYQNGVIVHDPHPSNDGIETVDYYEILTKIN